MVPRWFFSYVGTKTFAELFAPKYAFLGTYRPCRLIWCPLDWLAGGCGARAVLRKTPITYVFALKCYILQNTQKIIPFFPHLGDHLVNLVMEWQTDSAESAVFFFGGTQNDPFTFSF